jgi:hypothetical protein
MASVMKVSYSCGAAVMPRTQLPLPFSAVRTPTMWWPPVPKWKIDLLRMSFFSSQSQKCTSQGHSSTRRSQKASQ